ncbi:hypothetical protein Cst_c19100 [Thermoclostridium stercorarium subsp. stercorarium DSM 8532]|uniref:Uncharacterized protein n=1 Tax=Thermoclostridium stercorarium (strain ATCC 35414 / DSM 8532 / NCIMB 11754) TaxID=1121335 RepID=L7VQ03_THES1|nr:hypothetical protein Cst_c19100 [Thermoclostridium stercorarium subsp. stercorarium DSM 8532]
MAYGLCEIRQNRLNVPADEKELSHVIQESPFSKLSVL